MIFRRIYFALLAAGTLATVLVVDDGKASDRRMAHQYCRTQLDNTYDTGNGVYQGEYLQNRTGVMRAVRCAVPSDTRESHVNSTVLNVHGYEHAGNSNRSRACIVDYLTNTNSCGAFKNWGADHAGAASVDLSEWTPSRLFWYPYVHTELGDDGSLSGYYTYNP